VTLFYFSCSFIVLVCGKVDSILELVNRFGVDGSNSEFCLIDAETKDESQISTSVRVGLSLKVITKKCLFCGSSKITTLFENKQRPKKNRTPCFDSGARLCVFSLEIFQKSDFFFVFVFYFYLFLFL
jgi:hypothetical protein